MNPMSFDDYDEDFEHVTARRTLSEFEASTFITMANFNTPIFMDHEYASRPELHGGRVVPGMLTVSIAEGLCIGAGLVGDQGLALLEYRFTFQKAVYVGDTIQVRIRLDSKRLTSRPDRGVVTTEHRVENQHGETVAVYYAVRLLKTKAWSADSALSGGTTESAGVSR